jgi:hypothetical protein
VSLGSAPVVRISDSLALYSVAATVIPVFFVAVLLPGGLLFRFTAWLALGVAPRPEPPSSRVEKIFAPVRLAALCLVGVVVIAALTYAVAAEIDAVLVLSHEHASQSQHDAVLRAVVAFPILVGVGVAIAVFTPAITRIGSARADDPSGAVPRPPA